MFFKKFKSQSSTAKAAQVLGQKFERGKSREPSYIATDMSFEGNVVTDGEVHIDGHVHGNVRAHTCLVESKGEVQGGILADVVVVRGRVNGPIAAKQLTIQKGGHVEGNVQHGTINIENGAYVAGMVTQMTAEAAPPEAVDPGLKVAPAPKQLIKLGSNLFDKK